MTGAAGNSYGPATRKDWQAGPTVTNYIKQNKLVCSCVSKTYKEFENSNA